MNNNKQQPKPENPNNQFSNTEPLTHAQRVAIANKMSNNKQSMKLYTEKELKKHLYNHSDEFFEKLTPIELPSDEEINNEWEVGDTDYQNGCNYGAKWMRDKIQGGNNEQQ